MHWSLGPGEQALGSWGKSEDVWEKGGRGNGPQKRRRATETASGVLWRPPLLSTLVPPEAQALGRNFHPALFLAPTPPRIPAKAQSGAEMQPSLLGPGIAKSEASSKNLKLCFDLLTKITGAPWQPT